MARINAGEISLREYSAQAFAERRSMGDGLFSRLDDAMEKGDGTGGARHRRRRSHVTAGQPW